jgi:hypothetical protein
MISQGFLNMASVDIREKRIDAVIVVSVVERDAVKLADLELPPPFVVAISPMLQLNQMRLSSSVPIRA